MDRENQSPVERYYDNCCIEQCEDGSIALHFGELPRQLTNPRLDLNNDDQPPWWPIND